MCRLLGVIANKLVDLKFSLLDADKPFRSFTVNNPDGWGIGNYENNSTKVFKEGISAIESNELPTLSKEVISKIIIAHVRKASDKKKAPPSVENSHPFQYNNWMFAHNGSVDKGHLLEILDDKYKKNIKGQTDSEIFFYWILQCINKQGNVIGGIKKAVSEVKKEYYTALNFLLSDGANLYAFRCAKINETYYSLYKLIRNTSDSEPIEFISKETSVLIESKSLKGERAILVCSEKLTEENWEEINIGKLVIVDSNLNVKEENLL